MTTNERLYLQEFPDFDYVLPELDQWKDVSWHNDAIPRLETTIDGDHVIIAHLWCNYGNKELREEGVDAKFILSVYNEDMEYIGDVATAESLEELRANCNQWFLQNVGESQDDEGISIGEYLRGAAEMFFYHHRGIDEKQREEELAFEASKIVEKASSLGIPDNIDLVKYISVLEKRILKLEAMEYRVKELESRLGVQNAE